MDFGIFNVLQQRYRSKPSEQVIMEGVEQTQVAEQLGFSRAWYAEHHFSNYSLCPSPLMMAAHMAGVTKKIRLGSAVVVAPLYTPARLLAEIAFVDTLSGGRLELGIGSGYQNYEFERFGADLSLAKSATDEVVDMIQLGLTRPSFSYDGQVYKQPLTSISVRPKQSPLPPIWFASADPTLHFRAAREGHAIFISGVLGGTRRLVGQREGIEKTFVSAGVDPATLKLGLLRFAFVTESKKEAEHYLDCARYQQRLAVSLKQRNETVVDDYMIAEKPYADELPMERNARNLPVGDVETCAERMAEEIRLLRPTHVAIQPQLGDVDHKASLRSMELWMTRVVPAIEKALGRPLGELGLPAAAAA